MALLTRVNCASTNESYDTIQRDFDNVLGRLFLGSARNNGLESAACPVDVREDANHIYVEAELPGFKKEEVDVTLENLTLTISANKTAETNHKDSELLLHERRQRRFIRSFSLPSTVNEQSVNAKLQDGVLLVTLDKREETKPRKISVA